ncbi:MAG: AMP-binding protein [Methanothrix sp.]|jgi:acetyl-CoA synthetase|uniref:AMP-forming acetyl-CoA synthetase n=1 Tax=Methanothrix harundinacea TaxID=301375 RepID=A0A101IL12_9EURY|nr:MAG: AMP-forming acetyl-CoA synthetase [Methanothrix harundinacea]MDD3709307.1 AMP-binding protein [Methanothrix sp.]MDI9399417.1 AMP-binding protein [Euryarchaeota archaeon]KUK96840.1 MAG: AMP-forming acetyl-CoA synthetase [Methanothrix harundinacea]MCP1393401.1 AMP-binding protein [Methanothrix harundinacea]
MSSLLGKFVSRTDFESYENFKENFKITVPENFNFAFDVVDVYAEDDPDKVALVWCNDLGEEKIITFREMKLLSDKAANLFSGLGIRKGDAVMLSLKSRYEFWIAMIGLHKIGAVAIPATHMLKKKDIVYRIRRADLKMIVTIEEEGVPEEVDGACEELGNGKVLKAFVGKEERDGWLNFREELKAASPDFERPRGEEATENSDILLAYFTSGTTGNPKMVNHDQTYPLGHILTAKFWQNVEEDGLHYTVADTGWGKAVWGKLYGQWIAGSAVFVYDYGRFDAGRMMEIVSKYGVTTFCAPPTIYRFMIKEDMSRYDFSTLNYAVTAGEPLNPTIYNRFLEATGLRLMEGYGQTETVVAIANYPWMNPKPGSMGKPSPGYEMVLVDKNDKVCDVGEEGEIVIKTDIGRPVGLFVDYHLDPEKMRNTWHDDYYHTGDTAWIDEDGYFWFVGRADDIIKSSGYRVGPFEVESALLTHPAVLECAITGVPDKLRGQVVKATVVLTKGYAPSEELKVELQSHVKNITAPYKYPRIVEFADELPKTISGKIRRVEIREKDKPYPVINALECKACERCIVACPANVLALGEELNARGYRFAIYSGEGCIGCGNCYYTCPEPFAIEVHIPSKEKIEEE